MIIIIIIIIKIIIEIYYEIYFINFKNLFMHIHVV